MHRFTLVCICIFVLLPIVLSYPWNSDKEGFDDANALRAIGTVERRTWCARRKWCARWGDYCVPNAKVSFADCCEGLRCVCGKFWSQSKCECKSESTLG